MESNPVTIRVNVCFPTPSSVWQRELILPRGATIDDAVRDSGFQAEFPAINVWEHGVGVFGKVCQPSTILADGDRIEIYRALTFDPMVSRRRRADHRRAKETRARNGRERPAGLI